MGRASKALLFLVLSAWPLGTLAQTPPDPKNKNVHWANAAGLAYQTADQKLAPILISFATRYSAGNPGLSPEEVLNKTEELRRHMEKQNLPQKMEELAEFWDAAGLGLIGTGVRYFHRNYLKDHTGQVWNNFTGSARELASRPGFWLEIEEEAAKDPERTGKVVSALSSMFFNIDRSMDEEKLRVRVPGYEAKEEYEKLLDQATSGNMTAQEVREALNELGPELAERFDEVMGELKHQNSVTRSLTDWLIEQESKEQHQQRLNEIQQRFAETRAGINILLTVGNMAGIDDGTRRAINAAGILINLGEAFAIHAATGGSSLILANTSVSSFAALAGLMQDGPTDPTVELLNRVDQKLDQLRQEMHKSFAITYQKLDNILDTSFKIYREVLELGYSVEQTRIALSNLQRDLWTAEQRISAEIRALGEVEAVARRKSCLAAKKAEMGEIAPDFFRHCLFGFLTDATTGSLNALALHSGAYSAEKASLIYADGSARGLRYLAKAASMELGPNYGTAVYYDDIPNPEAWAAGANDYINFVRDWPELWKARADKKEHLLDIRQVGLNLRQALDGLSSTKIADDQTASRDPQAIIDALEAYYSSALASFSAHLDKIAAEKLRKNLEPIFGNPSALLGATPSTLPLCDGKLGWHYEPNPDAPAYEILGKGAGDPTQVAVKEITDEIRKLAPKWLLNSGGFTKHGLPRIKSVSVCVRHLVEKTDKRTCFAGSFGGGSMTPGRAILDVTIEFLKPWVADFKPTAPASEIYHTNTWTSVVEYPGGEACPPSSGIHWSNRLAPALPQIFANVATIDAFQLPRTFEELGWSLVTKSAATEDDQMKSAWSAVAYEMMFSASAIQIEASKIDAARAFVDLYMSTVFPEVYQEADLGLLLNGSENVKLPDSNTFQTTLACLSNPAAPFCDTYDMKLMMFRISSSDQWTTVLQERAKEIFSVLRDRTQEASAPPAYVMIDLTLGRLANAIKDVE